MKWYDGVCPRLGDSIADMHNGVNEEDFEVLSHIKIPCVGGSDFIIKQLTHMREQGYISKNRGGYCNKMLVVIEEGFGAVYTCVYSYDNRYFGLVTVKMKNPPAND